MAQCLLPLVHPGPAPRHRVKSTAAPPTAYSPAPVPAWLPGAAGWLHVGPGQALSPQILPPFWPVSGLRRWQGLESCRHLPSIVGAGSPCTRELATHMLSPATGRGEGLIGIRDGDLTPASAGAGPREQGGLRLRMSPSPATCGSCIPGCVRPAPADASAALVTCLLQSVTVGRGLALPPP